MYKKQNFKKDFWKIFFPLLGIFYIFIAYNLVDIYFAWWVWEKAIAWLQVAFPIFFLLLAFNEAFWTAVNNLASISLWEKKEKNIAKYFTIWTILSIFMWTLFLIFSNQIIELFFLFAWNLDEQVKQYTFDYAKILLEYSWMFIFNWMVWQLLIVFQKRRTQIFIASSILILNIVLDYIFVKYLNYGVSWIAYATIITWFFTTFYGLYYIILKEKITNFDFKLSFERYKKFIKFAITVFMVMLLTMLAIMVDNYFFWKIWNEALAAYAIWTKLKDFLFYPMIAGSIALSVLYGFFYWKKDFKPLQNILSWLLKLWFIYWIVLFVVLPIFWKLFWWFFSSNQLVIDYFQTYMFFTPIFLLWYIFRFIYSTILQVRSYHKARIYLNVCFLVFTFLFEYLLYYLYKSYISILIWAIIASILTAAITYLYYKIKVNNEFNPKNSH